MLLISHRGNISGRKINSENHPTYINIALRSGFYVEVDVFEEDNGQLMLGHEYNPIAFGLWKPNSNSPSYLVDETFLANPKILVHCKNINALLRCSKIEGCHYFYHSNDDFTVTSKGWPIAHSSQGAKKKTICMLPELHGLSKESVEGCLGVCSDIISFYE